jgi:hypothetical protein
VPRVAQRNFSGRLRRTATQLLKLEQHREHPFELAVADSDEVAR